VIFLQTRFKLLSVLCLLFISSFGISLQTSSPVLAQTTELIPVTAAFDAPTGTLTLTATKALRYRLEASQRRVVIPDATLVESTRYQLPDPSIIRASSTPDGLLFEFSYTVVASISTDNRVVTIKATSQTNANPAEQDERFPLIVPLANSDPQFVAGILSRSYNLKVEVDTRQRSVIVFATKKDWDFIRAIITALDLPRPQVAFEAEILEINDTLSQSLGINYRDLFSFTLTEGTPPGVFDLGDITRAPLNVKIGIDLLKTTGAATTLARPRVTTLDGVEARLNSTQTVSTTVAGPNNSQTLVTTTTGITLRLLPKVAPNNQIEASLSVAVSAPTGEKSFSTREANTTVRVGNGEPIVIGGLLENQRSTSTTGIPGLMDIPILGELFKTTNTVQRTTELVIVVTPYLIMPRSPNAPIAPPAPATPGER
jgi:general secretion pathway protein D